ncbi:tetratricopeptide repeat protein [Methanospirillum lacunae]|uniref:tetratricopeptide repeat protein n=1 Tax=Methanospirillum lacunae TaxID=668570 RepID=UPI0015E839AA|nr:tetratricopeptide repeat protein [Methanospirillum lacunae]
MDLYTQGNNLAKNSKYPEAIELYEKAILINQSYLDPWMGKGNAYLNLKLFNDSIAAYDKVIAIDPNNIQAWNGRGNSLKNINNFEDALTAYNKVITINPNLTSGYINKAGILQSLKRYNESIPLYNRAIELDPKSLSTYLNKASAIQKLNKYDDALAVYDQVLALNSSYSPAYTGKAGVLSTLKKYNEALDVYDHVIKNDSKSIWAWNSRGDLLQTLKRYDEAVSSYDHAIALNETNAPVWRSKAKCLQILKRPTEAMTALDQALANNPNYFEAWMDRGNLQLNLNNYQGSQQSFDQAIKINKNDTSAWNGKGQALMGLEKYNDATDAFSQCLSINPNLTNVRKNLEQAQFKMFQITKNSTYNTSNTPASGNFSKETASIPSQVTDSPQPHQKNAIFDLIDLFFGNKPVIPKVRSEDSPDIPNQVRLVLPVDVSLQNNTFLITDQGNHSIIISDYSGNIRLIIGGPKQSDLFTEVTSATLDKQGNIYVLDAGANKIFKFDALGNMLISWGSQGSDPGQFKNPRHIDYAPRSDSQEGILSVADSGNNRIQLFDLNGEYLSSLITLQKSDSFTSSEPHLNQSNNVIENHSYKKIIPEEKAVPALAERNFNVRIKDTTYPLSVIVDRRIYLGAQNCKNLDVNITSKNPEQWIHLLEGALSDPTTIDTIENISSLLEKCSVENQLTDSENLDLITTFIQQIPLVNEPNTRYPVEVLHDKKASSPDKAIFLYGLLYKAGYDVVFLSYPGTNHCAVGIRSDKSVNKPVMKEYTIDNMSYIYVNPDNPDIIGRINPSLNNIDPFILHILPQDSKHSLILPEREKRLAILETLNSSVEKKKFLEENRGKYSSAAKKQAQTDLDKLKSVTTYVESNTWNTEGISMRLKNSKVGDIQLMFGSEFRS